MNLTLVAQMWDTCTKKESDGHPESTKHDAAWAPNIKLLVLPQFDQSSHQEPTTAAAATLQSLNFDQIFT